VTVTTAGYSGTPLAKKLGIKARGRVFVSSAPANFRKLVAPLPDEAKIVAQLDEATDVVHVFATDKSHLLTILQAVMKKMRKDAAIWVSWPKKASRVSTDITEDAIRAIALPMGLVDIKVCAVDDVWSALKLVIRKERR
jgi:hypothetical protein